MTKPVSLYDAKSHLSRLVERAAAGEEIVITKNGVPRARLVPIASASKPRHAAGAMNISRIAPDFDELDPEINRLFGVQD